MGAEERGSAAICSSAWVCVCACVQNVKCVLLTQFAVHLIRGRINKMHLQLYFHAALYEMFPFRKHNNE